jgi:hypothetical protein
MKGRDNGRELDIVQPVPKIDLTLIEKVEKLEISSEELPTISMPMSPTVSLQRTLSSTDEPPLKERLLGVMTGQLVETKASNISLNPIFLLHNKNSKSKKNLASEKDFNFQRGAETKGEKLQKSYVRKETYHANQQAAQELREELANMKKAEVSFYLLIKLIKFFFPLIIFNYIIRTFLIKNLIGLYLLNLKKFNTLIIVK